MKKLLSTVISFLMVFAMLTSAFAEEMAMVPVELVVDMAEAGEAGAVDLFADELPEEEVDASELESIVLSAEEFEQTAPSTESFSETDAAEMFACLAGSMPDGALEGFVSLNGNELMVGGNGRVTLPDGFSFQSYVNNVTYYQHTKPTVIVGIANYQMQTLSYWTNIMAASGIATYSAVRNGVTIACGLRASRTVNYRYFYFNTSAYTVCISIGYNTEAEANTYINQIVDTIRLAAPLTVSTPVWSRSPDNQSIYINKPTISGGTGNYTIAYNIYDNKNQPVNYFYSNDEVVAATPGYTGLFCVFVVVSDGASSKTVNTGWFAIYTDAPLSVVGGSWSRSADDKHIFVNRPTISGGTGSYKVSYNLYDDKGNAVNYFYSDESRVAVSPGYNGNFNIYVTVNDGLSNKSIMTGWFTLTGY